MDVMDRLRAQDQAVDAVAGERRSLRPGGGRATSLEALAAWMFTVEPRSDRVEAACEALSAVAAAQVEHFPETLFWDVDLLAAVLLEASARSPAALAALTAATVSIEAQFGRRSVIRFRYAHDFSYGFDWARWVARAPVAREGIGPFDLAFLVSMARRGEELVELIEGNDRKYPPLPDGRPRNPFIFSRDPAHELALFQSLASDGLIPVEAWGVTGKVLWNKPFLALRDARARALAIPGKAEGGG